MEDELEQNMLTALYLIIIIVKKMEKSSVPESAMKVGSRKSTRNRIKSDINDNKDDCKNRNSTLNNNIFYF